MKWNWQRSDWPNFRYDKKALDKHEKEFVHNTGTLIGAYKHMGDEDRNDLLIDIISNEALKTSKIEGEYLNLESLRSSLRKCFGLATDNREIPPAEQGIAEMMTDLYRNYSLPLKKETLLKWHAMLMKGRRDLTDVGSYRTHRESMQVVSGSLDNPTVHFEAPPSGKVAWEMRRFIEWFNKTAPDSKGSLPALIRSGIAHLYFVSIHPFEDGNGRIGRAICEKILSQSIGRPTLIALAHVIEQKRKLYYENLRANNKANEITEWLIYFAKTILESLEYTHTLIDFIIEKTKFFNKFKEMINPRQEKVIKRIFAEGPKGFVGGLSADNYINITGTSRATATRDLQDLVKKEILGRTGELKATRYYLNYRK